MTEAASYLFVDLIVKGAGEYIKSYDDLEGKRSSSTDENDELYFVNAANHYIQVILHHYPSHLEVQVKECNQKGYDY